MKKTTPPPIARIRLPRRAELHSVGASTKSVPSATVARGDITDPQFTITDGVPSWLVASGVTWILKKMKALAAPRNATRAHITRRLRVFVRGLGSDEARLVLSHGSGCGECCASLCAIACPAMPIISPQNRHLIASTWISSAQNGHRRMPKRVGALPEHAHLFPRRRQRRLGVHAMQRPDDRGGTVRIGRRKVVRSVLTGVAVYDHDTSPSPEDAARRTDAAARVVMTGGLGSFECMYLFLQLPTSTPLRAESSPAVG